jgi:hypothetical protein
LPASTTQSYLYSRSRQLAFNTLECTLQRVSPRNPRCRSFILIWYSGSVYRQFTSSKVCVTAIILLVAKNAPKLAWGERFWSDETCGCGSSSSHRRRHWSHCRLFDIQTCTERSPIPVTQSDIHWLPPVRHLDDHIFVGYDELGKQEARSSVVR